MTHRTMRDFLSALEKKGLLRRIARPVDRMWEPAELAKTGVRLVEEGPPRLFEPPFLDEGISAGTDLLERREERGFRSLGTTGSQLLRGLDLEGGDADPLQRTAWRRRPAERSNHDPWRTVR